jgi:hypothetical protein
MTATTTERLTDSTLGAPRRGTYPIAANTLIRKGWQVALNASGQAVPADTIANGALFAVGKAEATVDNRTGSALGGLAAAADVEVGFGVNGWLSAAGADEITAADVGKRVFMLDNQTVALTDGGAARGPSGCVTEVRDGMVWTYQGPHVAGLRAGVATLLFSLNDFREVSSGGDPGAIAANGGILASDTTPILRGDAAESLEIAWAAGNADVILAQISLPPDFDGSKDVTVDLFVYTDNTGGGGIEAATFTVETTFVGAAVVADTATDTTPAVTVHKVTATIAAADIPDRASNLTLMLTPGTHANDPVQLVGARLNYAPRAA